MKFNLTKIALALATASLLASTAHAAPPTSVQLKFVGTVEKNTCAQSWSGTEVDTDFGTVGLVDGNAGTAISDVKPVTLKLTNCDVQGITVTYNGTQDGNTGFFANTGKASDVALKLTTPK